MSQNQTFIVLFLLISCVVFQFSCKKKDEQPQAIVPSCNITEPVDGSMFQAGNTILVKADIIGFSDAVSVSFTMGSIYSIDIENPPFEVQWDIPGMLADTLIIKAIAIDANVIVSDSILVFIIDTISPQIPPVPVFTITPITGTIDTIFIFDASTSHDTSTVFDDLLFRFDFEGDNEWDTDFTPDFLIEYKYNHSGHYYPVLQVMDTDSLTADTSLSLVVTHSTTPDPCEGYMSVPYGGKIYHTVRIGEQCWLRENLDIGEMLIAGEEQSNNQIIEKYCYNDDTNNCTIYGGLYRWREALNYLIPSQTARGICPSGYHIPSDEEWKELEAFSDTQFDLSSSEWDNFDFRGYDAGKRMKAMLGWASGGNGNNLTGFKAIPGGSWDTEDLFQAEGEKAEFWSATHSGEQSALKRRLSFDQDGISRSFHDEEAAFSIRCIRN